MRYIGINNKLHLFGNIENVGKLSKICVCDAKGVLEKEHQCIRDVEV